MKTYIDGSSCKAITGQYGEFFNLSFKLEELQKHVNDRWYINLVINKRKEVGQYGDTHSISLNEWTPDKSISSKTEPAKVADDISVEDLPF